MRNHQVVSVILVVFLVFLCETLPAGPAVDRPSIRTQSFETQGDWENLRRGSVEYYAPVDGKAYAVLAEGDDPATLQTEITVEAGKTYTLTLWARSIFSDKHTESLMGSDDDFPDGNPARVRANVELLAGSIVVAGAEVDVSPVTIRGAPEKFSNDDGGNIWVDGGYRHAFSESRFVQPIASDPLRDPWELAPDFEDYEVAQEDHGAVAPVIVGDKKLLYVSTFVDPDNENEEYSAVQFIEVEGDGSPEYEWPDAPPSREENMVISHAGDEEVVAFDQHIFYDEQEDRLWMTWGGNVIFVSELDPETGKLIEPQPNPEVVTHSRGLHHRVADRDEEGDRWTSDNGWIEGPTIYKHEGYWYLFASYGSLANNYTIRMGRSKQPTGPYLDKNNVPLTQYDPQKDRFGSSFFLGDDGDQVVSGHAHLWEEDGQFYVGYDYRTHKARDEQEDREARDILGIREMHWVRGWPTIWTPITVSFDADDDPEAVGKKIGIALKNNGDRGSVAAFDWVNLEVTDEVTDSSVTQ